MTRIGISITKEVAFRGATQEFSNVYYYDGLAGDPSQAEASNLIDEAANREKTFHASTVSFVFGRLWRQTSDKSTTEMLHQKPLSGVGARQSQASHDKERAYLFRLRAGVDSRGNPVYLRKYYHACGEFVSGGAPAAAILENTSGFSQAQRDQQVTQMQNIGGIGSGTTLGAICSKNGRLPTAGATWSAHAYLEHHQLGDQWRGG